jgi:nucleotide-binding universal stress UspA family protein
MNPVMLATDGSPAAAEATRTAIDLAAALGAPLLVVSCWDLSYVSAGIGVAPIVPDLDRIGLEQAVDVVEQVAEEARAAGVAAFTFVRRGDPARELCRIASERDARLIVVGSHGWGAVRRLVFGSVSTGVLHHARQPVLVVPSRPVRVNNTNGRARPVEVGGER